MAKKERATTTNEPVKPNERAGRSTTTRQVSVGLGILIACLILSLYLLQVTGILDLGLFDAMEETAAVESGGQSSPVSTISVGDDWIRVYFTSPRYPDDQGDHHGGLDEILAADIAQARASVDVAAYDFDLERVADALLVAHEGDIRVRLVTDSDNVDERAVRRLSRAGIPVVEDGRGAIMHNKFVVIDDHILWTGSWNLTDNGTYRNNNSAVRIVSAALAQNYTAEFEEMFVDRRFGPDSPSETPHTRLMMNHAGSGQSLLVENYFAPEDAVASRILDLVEGAEQSIRFMAFSFTDDRIGQTMVQKSKDGLVVQGVFEDRGSESEYSEYGRMRRARPSLDVLTDGNPYIMHHKVIILDEEIVILGSYNFSMSADESNDENLLVVHDPAVAALYLAEFQRIYDQAAAKE